MGAHIIDYAAMHNRLWRACMQGVAVASPAIQRRPSFNGAWPGRRRRCLLRIFLSDNASLARSEIAPALYERLFSLHLFPVFRWFDDHRTRILSTSSRGDADDCDCEYSVSVVLPCTKVLSKMSKEQAGKLREVEREYEEVLDQNCRVLAAYFKEVLVCENGDAAVSPPSLVLKSCGGGGGGGREERKEEKMQPSVMENGRYNVMFCV